jgi:hypothetical protein
MKRQRAPFESRWPVMLAILTVLLLLAALPGRVKVFPGWFSYAIALMALAPMAMIGQSGGQVRWLRLSRYVTRIFCIAGIASELVILDFLIGAMFKHPHDVSGLQLLASSIVVWALNVLMFSVLYWQMDRGGPEARAGGARVRPDFLFPQQNAPAGEAESGWRPAFIDYLYLGYTTATTFSAAAVAPLTGRATVLMMAEGGIALVTIVVVAARAINILG